MVQFLSNICDRHFSPSYTMSTGLVCLLGELSSCWKCYIELLMKIVALGGMKYISFSDITRTRRSHLLNIAPFRSYINCFKNSLFPRTVGLWNGINKSTRTLQYNDLVLEVVKLDFVGCVTGESLFCICSFLLLALHHLFFICGFHSCNNLNWGRSMFEQTSK